MRQFVQVTGITVAERVGPRPCTDGVTRELLADGAKQAAAANTVEARLMRVEALLARVIAKLEYP